MVDVKSLPPQKAPKQITARFASLSLHQNFLAFLNSNNRSGFLTEEIAALDTVTVLEFLTIVFQHESVPQWKFKTMAKRLKKTSNRVIRHTVALEIVSRLFGYENWEQVSRLNKNSPTLIQNKRSGADADVRRLLGL